MVAHFFFLYTMLFLRFFLLEADGWRIRSIIGLILPGRVQVREERGEGERERKREKEREREAPTHSNKRIMRRMCQQSVKGC